MSDASPIGHRVPRPTGALGTLAVYLNGRPVAEGTDYTVEPDALVFAEPLNTGRKTGFLGRLQMTTIGIGVYEKVDKVDIHCTTPDGDFQMFTELEALPGT
jgi:hypothetical protein